MPHREGMGSGVIIDKSGIVLTNNHVVEGADEVTVQLADGREFKAEDIKTDPQTDLAVLRIKGAGTLPAATLGNSDELEIGDWVIAIGNPFGLDHTVSAGIISGKGRELGIDPRTSSCRPTPRSIRATPAARWWILNGEVIGINTAIATNSGGFAGIGFAIPSNTAKWVMNQLIKKGQRATAPTWAWPSVTVSSELAEKFGVQRGEGVLVSEVFPNSPAAEAGIQGRGRHRQIRRPQRSTARANCKRWSSGSRMGSKQTVEVLRDGKPVTLPVTAKSLPKNFGLSS